MIGLIVGGVVSVAGAGTWLYFHGERALDAIIDYQKKRRAGYFKKSKVNEACKACGWKKGDIVWNPELERLIHSCQVCGATWPETPRVPAHLWDILGKMIKFNRESAQDVKEVFERANAPIEIKKTPEEAAVN